MAAHDLVGDECPDRSLGSFTLLDGLECVLAEPEALPVSLKELRDPGVQIPAVVVEPLRRGESFDLGLGLPLEMQEPDDHVRHLDSGVVDVVLDLDVLAAEAQRLDEGVAESGVAQVTDVSSLVGVDIGVLDDDLASRGLLLRGSQKALEVARPIEEHVQVSRPGHVHPRYSLDLGKRLLEALRDLSRGLLERARELEGDGKREVSELGPRRSLAHDRADLDAELGPHRLRERGFDSRANSFTHGWRLYKSAQRAARRPAAFAVKTQRV